MTNKDSLISLFELIFGTGSHFNKQAKRPGSLNRGAATNFSGIEHNNSVSNNESHLDPHQQIEEYERLFSIMNGPIENLVNFSREQALVPSQRNRNKSMKRPLTVRMDGVKRA